jgi:hypothetical protein
MTGRRWEGAGEWTGEAPGHPHLRESEYVPRISSASIRKFISKRTRTKNGCPFDGGNVQRPAREYEIFQGISLHSANLNRSPLY